MPFIQGIDRNQLMMCSLEQFVAPQSIARIIDAFTSGLDLENLGFTRPKAASEGRPAYDTRSLLNLYLYGSRKSIRSSRKLRDACSVNVEIMWLMNWVEPDFRTISDFRKDNIDCLKKVFKAFNRKLAAVLTQGFKSIDGSKFQAWNSKDNNFTANKLDDRIAWLNQHADEYLRQMDELDRLDEDAELSGQFTKVELEDKLMDTLERLERYKGYREYMEKNGLSQLSLTDLDSKLMKSKNGFMVAYNIQTVVDSETHLIDDFQTTDRVTDHGLIYSNMESVKKDDGEGIVEVTADKGYHDKNDMMMCLENGLIPHVTLPDGQDCYDLETVYEQNECGEETVNSSDSQNLKKCLRAGIIPKVYEKAIEKAEIIERRQLVRDVPEEGSLLYGTAEEMIVQAKEGYFIRDPERNIVYCPSGATLRQKSVKKNGNIRYANKFACMNCKYKGDCIKSKADWKEVDFSKDTIKKPNKDWQKAKGISDADISAVKKRGGRFEKVKIVKIKFRPDRKKMNERKCISEHPFGTIKRAMNADYFLLRRKKKVDGEVALMCFGYNLIVALNLLGFEKMMNAMTA